METMSESVGYKTGDAQHAAVRGTAKPVDTGQSGDAARFGDATKRDDGTRPFDALKAVGAARPAFQAGDGIDDATAAGNWEVFRRRCAFVDAAPMLGVQENIDVKRHYALAYLGDRAQMRGGVFRASKPTVFTESMVAALGKRNTAERFARYPWLEQMLALITALDDAQYNVANQAANQTQNHAMNQAMTNDRNVLAFPDSSASRAVAP